jgi:hypothetical protein
MRLGHIIKPINLSLLQVCLIISSTYNPQKFGETRLVRADESCLAATEDESLKSSFLYYLFIYLFIYLHVHTLFGSFLHHAPPAPRAPAPPQFQAGPILPLWLILLKKRHKHNKKDKVFLLLELRIAIQKDSYYCSHVPMCYDPCWFNSKWSLHWFLIPC